MQPNLDSNDDLVEISTDGKMLTCRSYDGRIRCRRGLPSRLDWKRFFGTERADVGNGIFQYAGIVTEDVVYAVFNPARSLDFIARYNAATGELLNIPETR